MNFLSSVVPLLVVSKATWTRDLFAQVRCMLAAQRATRQPTQAHTLIHLLRRTSRLAAIFLLAVVVALQLTLTTFHMYWSQVLSP